MSSTEEETKKNYIIKPIDKKAICEEQTWCNTLSNKRKVSVTVNNVFRWGSFEIELTEKQKEELLKLDEIDLDYYDYNLIETWDGGCDFWVDIIDEEKLTEKEQDEIHELLYSWGDNVPEDEDPEDEGYNEEKMEHNGWVESESRYIISSKCELTEIKN